MRVSRLNSLESLRAVESDWNQLDGGIAFRSISWLSTWWRHYDEQAELAVLVVRDEASRILGIAPWCVQEDRWQGRIVRFLGSGEVCSDYQSILCRLEDAGSVARALADRLCGRDAPGEEALAWDLLDLDGVTTGDRAMDALAERLADRGLSPHATEGLNVWRLALPTDWEAYLAGLSKGHRKQIRRLITRVLQTDRARWHTVEDEATFDEAFDILIDLHQRRWQSLGEPGCFASPRFTQFHRAMARAYLDTGQLRLGWLELDGRPAAAEYGFVSDGVLYCYQSGVDPDRLDESPGALSTTSVLRAAVAEGLSAVDFLRGDEPYKAHWRAEPSATSRIQVVSSRPTARIRHNLWRAARGIKHKLVSKL